MSAHLRVHTQEIQLGMPQYGQCGWDTSQLDLSKTAHKKRTCGRSAACS